MKKITAVLIMTIMLACLICSCGEETVIIEGRSDFPVTVNGVEIASAPQRVICLSPSITEIIYELGSYTQLYGVSDDCDWPEETAQKEKMGTSAEPDTEKIISAVPDLVLVSGSLDESLSESLSLRGIPVISIEAAQSIEGLKDVYVSVATALAGKETGQINGETTYNNLIDKIKQEASVAGMTLKRAVFIPADGIIAYSGSFISDIMSLAGAQNIAQSADESGDWAAYVAALNPDYIFCAADIEQSILSNPTLAETNAVKSGSVRSMDPALYERQGGRIYEAAMEMYRFMYGTSDVSEADSSAASDAASAEPAAEQE